MDGHSFAGWYTAPRGAGGSVTAESLAPDYSEFTLYAAWRLITVSYLGNGQSGGNVPEPWSWNPEVRLRIAGQGGLRGPILRDGITQRFLGWNTMPDGSGTDFEPGYFSPVPKDSIVLYAQWTKDEDAIGKIGPAGGYIFHDRGPGAEGWRYLEAAPADAEWTILPFLGPDAMKKASLDPALAGADVGSGAENTLRIIAALGPEADPAKIDDKEEPAALRCDALAFGGFDDWFLPSKEELALMHERLFSHDPPLGGFAPRSYWSSTWADSGKAWFLYFKSGLKNTSDISDLARVRAVRAF